jgi:hypothetical protein
VDNEDVEENQDGEDIEVVDIKVAPYRTVVTTPVTIWVGILPDTLTGEVAFHSSNVDVVYRESVARDFT